MILRVIVLIVLFVVVWRAVRLLLGGILEAAGPPPRDRPAAMKLVRDPICGTHVPTGTSLSLQAGGRTHHFCSQECLVKFRSQL